MVSCMKHINEMKIGVFVIAALILLLIGWAFLREFSIYKQLTFLVEFDDVAGLTKGSFVRINGLRVGRVDNLTLDTKKNKVLVKARIQLPNVQIPKDSVFYIRTSGYVGDKYLDVALGMSNSYINEGEVVLGDATFDSFKSLEKVSEVINQIDPKLLGQNIQEFTSGAVGFLKKADSLAESADKAVKGLPQGKDLEKLVTQAYETIDRLNNAIDKVGNIAKDETANNNISRLLSQANEISSDLKSALDNANDLANNERAFSDLNDMLVRASKIVEQLDELRADPLIQNELRTTLTNTNTAAKSVTRASEELSDALHQRFLLPRLWFGKLLKNEKKED